MKPPEADRPPAPDPQRSKVTAFRQRSGAALPTSEQPTLQGDGVQSAWRHFGEPESDEHRNDLDKRARNERISAEDDALDAAVQKSIRLYGA